MKGLSIVIYLVGLLPLLIAKNAIGQSLSPTVIESKTDQGEIKQPPNSTTSQEIILKVANDCEKSQVGVSSSITKIKNIEKTHKQTTNNRDSFLNATQERFWWAAEQFDPFGGKLIQNWLTYPKKQQVNLVVSWQLWGLLDYLGRYRFVNQFGTEARRYGYSLNVFNQKEQCLATYQYNKLSNPPKWELNLEKLGQDSLQVKPPKQLTNN